MKNNKRAVNRHQTQSKASASAQERAIERVVRQAVAKEIRQQQQAPFTCYLYVNDDEGQRFAVRVTEMPFQPHEGMELVIGAHPTQPEYDVEMTVESVAFDLATETVNVDLNNDGWSTEALEGWGFTLDQPEVLRRTVDGNVVSLRPTWVKPEEST